MYIKKIKIPIYGGNLKVIITKDPTFSDVNKKYDTRADDNYNAFVFQDGDYCIAMPPSITGGVICHESIHLTNMVFGYVGIKLSVNNDEAQAYFTQWFYENIEKVLNKYKAITK